jgi:hypothetical protein
MPPSRLRVVFHRRIGVITPLETKTYQGGNMTGIVTGASATSVAHPESVSPARVFWATWFGWMLDGFDSSMYSYILVGALTELLPASGIAASPANIGLYGGLLFSIFMLVWACSMI